MKYIHKADIRFCDCGPNGTLGIGHLTRYLHEAAGRHSISCGDGAAKHATRHTAWVLHKFGMRIERLPRIQEEIEIATWSREPNGFKALREYSLSAAGESIVSASSIWLLIDLMDNRLLRVTEDALAKYKPESSRALDMDLDSWKTSPPSSFPLSKEFNLRANDFDINGHVNNSVYFDLLESVLEGQSAPIVEIRVEFLKGAEAGQELLRVEISEDGKFRILSGDVVCVRGEFARAFRAK